MLGWRRVIWPLALVVVGCIAGFTAQMSATPQSAQQVDAEFFPDLRWRSIGPSRAGRVVAVTGVRGEPETYYFGAVGGGVWKTDDAGRTWNPIFDSQPVASIGALAVRVASPSEERAGKVIISLPVSGLDEWQDTRAIRTWL